MLDVSVPKLLLSYSSACTWISDNPASAILLFNLDSIEFWQPRRKGRVKDRVWLRLAVFVKNLESDRFQLVVSEKAKTKGIDYLAKRVRNSDIASQASY
jgi:hypothetical protein